MAEDPAHKAARQAAVNRAVGGSFATTAGQGPRVSEAQARAAGVLGPLSQPAPEPPPEPAPQAEEEGSYIHHWGDPSLYDYSKPKMDEIRKGLYPEWLRPPDEDTGMEDD